MAVLLRRTIVALACAGLGCPADSPPAPSAPRSPRATSEPIPCESDSDCPALSCGPCTPGQVVTRWDATVNCHHDPCIDGGSVCGADHQCVVHEGAKKDPRVWCRGCASLGAEAASICARAEDEATCSKSLAEAVASCDDDKCKTARDAVRVRSLQKEEEEETPANAPTNDELTPAQVAKGFLKARTAVLACPGAAPGTRIRISATIDAEGDVLAAKAIGSGAATPLAQCVVEAVEKHARFSPTERPVDEKVFTYAF